MVKRLSSIAWEKQRPTILQLYLKDDIRLEDVISFMATNKNFKATEAAYKNKFRRWNVKKRGALQESLALYQPLNNNYNDNPLATQSLVKGNQVRPEVFNTSPSPNPFSTALAVQPPHAPPPQPESPYEFEDWIDYTGGGLDSPSRGSNEFHNLDFNDETSQELDLLLSHISTIIHTFTNAGGFAHDVTAETFEDLFTTTERQRKLDLLERVLSAEILLFGSRSSIFLCHARRFSKLTLTDQKGKEHQVPVSGVSFFRQALQVISGDLAMGSGRCCRRHIEANDGGHGAGTGSTIYEEAQLIERLNQYPFTI